MSPLRLEMLCASPSQMFKSQIERAISKHLASKTVDLVGSSPSPPRNLLAITIQRKITLSYLRAALTTKWVITYENKLRLILHLWQT